MGWERNQSGKTDMNLVSTTPATSSIPAVSDVPNKPMVPTAPNPPAINPMYPMRRQTGQSLNRSQRPV